MTPIYQHTQIGTAIIALFAFVIVAVVVWLARPHPFFVAVLALIALVAVLFSTLTVTVGDRDLSWHFTFGFWEKQIPLVDIASAEPVTNKWYWGLGILATPKGRLYNVSRLGAVAITETNGRRCGSGPISRRRWRQPFAARSVGSRSVFETGEPGGSSPRPPPGVFDQGEEAWRGPDVWDSLTP